MKDISASISLPNQGRGEGVGNAPQVSPFNGSGLDPESSHLFKLCNFYCSAAMSGCLMSSSIQASDRPLA